MAWVHSHYRVAQPFEIFVGTLDFALQNTGLDCEPQMCCRAEAKKTASGLELRSALTMFYLLIDTSIVPEAFSINFLNGVTWIFLYISRSSTPNLS